MTDENNRTATEMDESKSIQAKVPTVDDFQFVKPISRGAFGKVFLGHKVGCPEKVYAIKVVKKADMINKNLTDQVVAERDAMAKGVSPFVVQLYYSIQSQQNIFLAMEYMIGGDVSSLLAMAGYFDEPMAIAYIAEVTLALQYLHRKGIVHRDLKPDNMLISADGHIKLTDFGLAKLTMNFSDSGEVPMTPKTPMHSLHRYEDYRTPGQILSLQSSFAFSSIKYSTSDNSSGNTPITPASKAGTTPQTPLNKSCLNQVTPISTVEKNTSAPHSTSKLNKQMSMRDLLLSQSTSKYLNTSSGLYTPGKSARSPSKPPVKRLMSTLQKSDILWAASSSPSMKTGSDCCDNNTTDSTEAGSSLPELSSHCFDSCNKDNLTENHTANANRIYLHKEKMNNSLPSTISTIDISDDVFMSGFSSRVDMSEVSNKSDFKDERLKEGDTSVSSCNISCVCDSGGMYGCLECGSHQKAPSRQEKLTDDTPQMHRTEESVWNSYAAKHLRSLRRDSYSEDSGEDNEKENVPYSLPGSAVEKKRPVILRCKVRTKINPRRLTKTKSFCYPSDEENESEPLRYSERFRFAKKRNFDDVEQSPVRRTHSVDSGLTQEIALLRFSGCEPQSKRSHSIPRTRIRFHSGHDKAQIERSVQSPLLPKLDMRNCLGTNNKDSKSFHDSDRITVLSADERRLVEGHSDISMSESDHILSESDTKGQSKDLTEARLSDKENSNPKHSSVKPNNILEERRKDSLDCNEPVVTGSCFKGGLVNKNLSHLQPRMVSSLNSESAPDTLGFNLSSLCEGELSNVTPDLSNQMDMSVFNSPTTVATASSGDKEEKVSPDEPKASSVPLLPPPPPKTRRPSGKKTPAKLRFASMTSCISPYVHNESRNRNSSGWNDVSFTPGSHNRYQGFCTPNPRCPQTPKTPLQKALARSYSFSNANKTPFRTPKSVKRAPLHEPEQERILGTPDYLAPEILQQKRHGPAVDWWSLGVCMFEFLTGVRPFNDQTVEKVFENILNRDIPWPEGEEALSEPAREAIEALLTPEPSERPKARDLKKMPVFKEIDWKNILNKDAPWVPVPEDLTDTSYFEARNMMQDLFVSDVDFR